MAWTTPKTWTSDPLTSSDMNAYIRDNQNYLYGITDGEAAQYIRTASNYSTTSGSLVDMDATNMNLSITTTGRDVAVTFAGFMACSATVQWYVGVRVDDTTDYQIVCNEGGGAGDQANASFTYILSGLSAGSHEFKMRWSTDGGTLTGFAGAMLFDVREVTGVIS